MRDNSGAIFRRIPIRWDCDEHCQSRLSPAEWNAAVSQFEQDRRDSGGQ